MSWIRDRKPSWIERLCFNVLKCGPIPKHVAFIMDGNRRYVTQKGMDKLQGYSLGLEKLLDTFDCCLHLGIKEITVYACSLENFKRSEEEINCLMELARKTLKYLLGDVEKYNKVGVCFRMWGDISLLPADIQYLVAEVVLQTRNNTNAYLNFCIAYTSREETCSAVKSIASAVTKGTLKECDISEDLLNRSLYSGRSTYPDLMIRTSGEVRLSDFLLWQSSYSLLLFLKVFWPALNVWHPVLAVLYYQNHFAKLREVKEQHAARSLHEQDQWEVAECSRGMSAPDSGHSASEDVARVRQGMEDRRRAFLEILEEERYQQLLQISRGNTNVRSPPLPNDHAQRRG